ncbi:MAG: metallophosphoesterase family protein [Ginsengibacter sp.]
MNRAFAIGDIHGCSNTFKKLLLEKIEVDKSDTIYCVGDYIDRGPDSKGVIDFILNLRAEGYQIHTLRGNHEQMLMDSITGEFDIDIWLKNGGTGTLRSFGIQSLDELPEHYMVFFKETKYYFKIKDYIIVHAGLNFNNKDILADEEAMLWIRDFSPEQPALKDLTLIHGHTPKPLDHIINQKGNCLNIDGGCVYSKRKNMGNLVAFNLDERNYICEVNCE